MTDRTFTAGSRIEPYTNPQRATLDPGLSMTQIAQGLGGGRLSDSFVPFCIYGDSRAGAGFNGTANAFDLRGFVAAAPTGSTNGGNYVFRASSVQFYYPPARVVAWCGHSGDTLANMVTREGNAASATRQNMDDGYSCGARVMIFWAGINSISTLTTATYSQATVDTIIAAREDLLQRAVSRGFIVFDMGESGYDYVGDSTNYPQTRIDNIRRTISEVNKAAATFAANSNGSVFYIDSKSLVCDADGQWLPGMCEDVADPGQRVHPSARAAGRYGRAQAALAARLFGASSGSYHRYGNALTANLIPNLDLSASTSGLATGWSHSGNGTSPVRTPSIVTRKGKRWQTILCSFGGSNAVNYAQLNAPLPIQSGGTITVTAGEVYGFEMDIFIDDGFEGAPPSPYNLQVPPGRIRIYGAAGNLFYDACSLTGAVAMPNDGPFEGHLTWAPITMAESTAALTASTAWQVGYGNVIGETFRIGASSPRMVRIS